MRHNLFPLACHICCVGLLWAMHAHVVCAQDDSGFKFVEVKVVDPAGKPVANTSVEVKIDDMEFAMPTNDKGIISLNVPSGGNTQLILNPKHEDFVADQSVWQNGQAIPTKITIKLEKGVAIGGLIHDEKGQPIEGVMIRFANFETIQIGARFAVSLHPIDLGTTDSEGRWKASIKQPESKKLALQLSHDDYICNPSFGSLATWEQLTQLDHVLTLKKGLELKGRVTDEQGEPVAGAYLLLGTSRYLSNEDKKKKKTQSDAEGNYRFGNVTSGSQLVTVTARGRAPELRRVAISRDMEPVDFELQPGHTVKILVTDVDGVPISGVGIMADEWRNQRTFPEELHRGETNDQGIWQSDSMPADMVKYDLFKQGYLSSRNRHFAASEKTHTIVLQWPLVVSGKVMDAESGLPLEKFNVVQGIDWGNPGQKTHWERHNDKLGEHGKYKTEFTEPRAGHYVRIEAAGYRPQVSRVIRDDEGEVTINFEMEEGTGPSGTVKLPDGTPAAGAQLLIATRDEQLFFRNAVAEQNGSRKPKNMTDKLGKYQLPFLGNNFILVCLHDSGWAQVTNSEMEKSSEIQLQPWATVEGVVMQGKQPMAGETLQLNFQQLYVQNAPSVNWYYDVESDAEGRFKFERAIAGDATVGRVVRIGNTGQGSLMSTYSHAEPVTLTPGQTVRVQVGGSGRRVRGQFKIPEDSTQKIAWHMGYVQLYSQPQRNDSVGGFFHALGKAIGQIGGQPADAPKSNLRRSYAAAINEQGVFEVADMHPGRYHMAVQIYPLSENGQQMWQPIASLAQIVTVSAREENDAQNLVELGEFTLKMATPAPPRSAAPALIQATPLLLDE